MENHKDWERNMLALLFADGWYYYVGSDLRGPKRVLSLKDGALTFRVPDDFDLGNLRQIPCNWDGHTSEGKWIRIGKFRNSIG